MTTTTEYAVQPDSSGYPCCYLLIEQDGTEISRVESNVVAEAVAIGLTTLTAYHEALKTSVQETIDRVVESEYAGAFVSASCMEYATLGNRLIAVETAIRSLSV